LEMMWKHTNPLSFTSRSNLILKLRSQWLSLFFPLASRFNFEVFIMNEREDDARPEARRNLQLTP
jgi:hypothetical protein